MLRRAVRVLLLDDTGRILLIRDSDLGLDPVPHWWATPGGGVDPGETDAQTAVRELWEETGLRVTESDLDGPLITRRVWHGWSDKTVDQTEVFFRVRVPAFDVDTSRHTEEELLTIAEMRWWDPGDLDGADEPVWPADLSELLALADEPDRWRDGPLAGPDVEESTVPVRAMDLTRHRPRWAELVGPGIWTDLVVASLTGSDVHDEGDHLRVVTPDNPTFRWGNYLDILDPTRADDVDLWLARFAAAFPDARHRTFGLPGPVDPAWTERGFEADVVVTLLADDEIRDVPLPEGYTVHTLGVDAPWSDAVDLFAAHWSGAEPVQDHRVFLERQTAARARAVAAGRAWFGVVADRDGAPAAHLGIVDCGGVGRYQSVLTRREHRRLGLAGHLVGRAAAWARDRGAGRLVIVTEEDNPAGRLYRSLGFDGTALSYGVSVPDVTRLAEARRRASSRDATSTAAPVVTSTTHPR